MRFYSMEVLFTVSSLNDKAKENNTPEYSAPNVEEVKDLYAKDSVSLYRAIGESEFYSIMRTKRFSFWSRSAKVKYFAKDLEETVIFANKAFATDIVAVLEIIVNKRVLEQVGDFTNADTTLFKTGTVEIHPEHIDEFNDAITEIIHRY